MILRSPAKVNLYLRVIRKRPDGYHNIETVFEKIALFDTISFRSLPEKTRGRKAGRIKISCNSPKVPTGTESLAYRAVSLLKKQYGVTKGVEIKIFKKIPIASGLGGGSSNAATILSGLNKMWKLSLGPAELSRIGRSLGADVPFFLNRSSFAVAKERGDRITPIGWKKARFWHLLIYSPITLFSRDIYRIYSKKFISGLSPQGKKTSLTGLTKKGQINTILSPVPGPKAPGDIAGFIFNDLEKVILEKEPVVGKIKNAFKKIGIGTSLVSGSGPSVFALFENRKEAVKAKAELVERFPFVKKKGWQIFIVPTL